MQTVSTVTVINKTHTFFIAIIDVTLEKTGFQILLLTNSFSTSRRHKSGLDRERHKVTKDRRNGICITTVGSTAQDS